jgi:hypothetical protein
MFPKVNPEQGPTGSMRTVASYAVGVGLAGWPLGVALGFANERLEATTGNSLLSNATLLAAGVLFFLAPFSLIFGLAVLRSWKTLVVVVAAGGAFIALLPVLDMYQHRFPNEFTALDHLRAINRAQVNFHTSRKGSYGTIQELVRAGLLDETFQGPKDGYVFNMSVSRDGKEYTAAASPTTTKTGRYGFYSLPDAVVRYATRRAGQCEPCFPEGWGGTPVQ